MSESDELEMADEESLLRALLEEPSVDDTTPTKPATHEPKDVANEIADPPESNVIPDDDRTTGNLQSDFPSETMTSAYKPASLTPEKNPEMANETAATALSITADNLKKLINPLPTAIHCEIGTLDLSYEVSKSIAVGTLFDLKKGFHSPVTLIKNDTALAEAEIVNLNGQMGIRITRILN